MLNKTPVLNKTCLDYAMWKHSMHGQYVRKCLDMPFYLPDFLKQITYIALPMVYALFRCSSDRNITTSTTLKFALSKVVMNTSQLVLYKVMACFDHYMFEAIVYRPPEMAIWYRRLPL